MEIALLVYLIDVFGKVSTASAVLLAIICILAGLFLTLLPELQKHDESYALSKKALKPILIVVSIVAFVWAFAPDRKTMYLMVGGYTAQSLAQSEIGDKVHSIIMKELNSMLDEK